MISASAQPRIRRENQWQQACFVAVVFSCLLLLTLVVNPVIVMATILAVGGVWLAWLRPLPGFLGYLVAIQGIDFLKRLLLAFGSPSPIEWYGILLLPDCILLTVFARVLTARQEPPSHTRKYHVVARFLCLYALWYTARAVWTSALWVNSLGKWKLVAPYFLCFYLGERLLANKNALLSMLKVLAVSLAVAALYGLYQFCFGLTSFEQRWLFEGYTSLVTPTLLYGEGTSRAFSFYSDADTFASTLACVGTLLLFSRRAFGRWWWNSYLLLSLMGAALLVTVVRAGWLHAFLGGIAFFWTQAGLGSVRKIAVLGVGVGLLIAAGLWATSALADLDSPLLARALVTGTYNTRMEGYQNLLEMGVVRFVVGEGVAAMPGSVKDLSDTGAEEGFVGHDLISDLLFELGWIGFVLLGVVILRSLAGPFPESLGQMLPGIEYLVWSVPLVGVLFGGSILVVRPVTTLLWSGAGILCAQDADAG